MTIPTALDEPFAIILIGPPGSGKGTLAPLLSEKLSLPHISTGDLFRHHIKSKSPLGIEAKKYIEQGHLVPDLFVLKILFTRLQEPDCQNGFILDGFPRTLDQAKALDERLFSHERLKDLEELKKGLEFPLDNRAKLQKFSDVGGSQNLWPFDGDKAHSAIMGGVVALNLELSDNSLMDRITGRLTCTGCSKPYHKKTSPPLIPNTCDLCHSPLQSRKDDTEEVFLERLKVYRKETAPLISYYREKGLLLSVFSDQEKSGVLLEALEKLNLFKEKGEPFPKQGQYGKRSSLSQ